ncbi:Hypothetical protein EIN_003560, partial [Entamoeba invadens IP1]
KYKKASDVYSFAMTMFEVFQWDFVFKKMMRGFNTSGISPISFLMVNDLPDQIIFDE